MSMLYLLKMALREWQPIKAALSVFLCVSVFLCLCHVFSITGLARLYVWMDVQLVRLGICACNVSEAHGEGTRRMKGVICFVYTVKKDIPYLLNKIEATDCTQYY